MKYDVRIIRTPEIHENMSLAISKGIRDTFRVKVLPEKILPIPETANVPSRNQYNVTLLFKELNLLEDATEIFLYIVHKDLFSPGLNWVFGSARHDIGAIVSLARVSEEEDFARKEAVHEIGHVFGLSHCSLPCVMTFSNSVLEARMKSERLCRKCRIKINISG